MFRPVFLLNGEALSLFGSLFGLGLLDRLPDQLRGGWHVDMGDAIGFEGIHNGIDDGLRGDDGSGLAPGLSYSRHWQLFSPFRPPC